MKLAIDVQYAEDSAVVAGILFQEWDSSEIKRTLVVEVSGIEPYEPGAFHKRELPCILELLKEVTEELEVIVIEGFVKVGENERDGLVMHLYRALNEIASIIGIAKKLIQQMHGKHRIPTLLKRADRVCQRINVD